ncbi:PAP/25A associated domain protein [Dictyocaulus viviparus]|uniref:PAP/25A associated domain protein n=1 Tax=Dictyocaulus viviparus TaxID=29172 RepID=A0A0D8XVH3_DICVI|nr:PAP/25A associated domain protein [Dictyocaulus viviparus]
MDESTDVNFKAANIKLKGAPFLFVERITDPSVTGKVVESAELVENAEDNKVRVGIENKSSEHQICYEDFFIKLEQFDEHSYRQQIDRINAEEFKYTFENASNFNNGYIFGSLISGFGVTNSDVDICFRFQEDEQPLNVDGVKIVREIAQSLEEMEGMEKVYPITGAKVPIVKFRWPKLGFEGEYVLKKFVLMFYTQDKPARYYSISYYNVLALHNTEMLRKYCQWDARTAPLGVWVKRWAKSCDIGDASRGSLSSYAFIILLIHFLQNCEPPVLPRLQEDFRNDYTVPIVVDNCDVYFHRDVIDGWSRNRMSVGELFTGFLDYFSRFDFDTEVVQIRRKKPLLKVEKMWHRPLCIEDPFNLSHNLGSGVSKRMYVFIIQNIRNSRKHFLLSDIRHSFLVNKGIPTKQEMPYTLCATYGVSKLKDN